MEETADGFERYVLSYFGLPRIFQSDNGTEFRNQVMRRLVTDWDGDCKMVHGRPRHPQSQGLVEQSNGTLERKLSSMLAQFKDKNWVELLPKVQYIMNTQKNTGFYY